MGAYGIPAARVDGNDPLAVFDALTLAAERARNGEGPTFVEAMTYRTCGHYQADSGSYRTKDEIEAWRLKSPLISFQAVLIKKGLKKAALQKTAEDARREVQLAVQTAVQMPVADLAGLREDVFA
jgi:pyruvate dehydrogenase E1 component alpha subunit